MTWEIREGDVLDRLREMPDESVHCVVTSPPYWGLRDYGVAGQIGLEPTPAAYLARMVEVFREVRRVLRSDGSCWVNMGDGYASGEVGRHDKNAGGEFDRPGWDDVPRQSRKLNTGLKPKDLIGMPWRLAFALQDDGWWLRSEIIWAKPNPMPESVTDRPTKAHEQIFLLTKAARYWYDADAIREPSEMRPQNRYTDGRGLKDVGYADHRKAPGMTAPAGRNARSVWNIATQPFAEAHFATFPEELPRRCIKAGTSERGVCPQCGAPWTRVVERTPMTIDRSERTHALGRTRSSGTMLEPPTSTTTGWQPTCSHGASPIPATVLDPFAGSGTTIMVALQLGRSGLGIELNPEYAAMARRRIEKGTMTQASSGQASLFGGEGGLP